MTCSRLVGWVPRLGSGRIYHDGSHHQDCNSFGRKSPKKHLLLPLLLVGGGDTRLTTLMKTQATVNSVGILLINYERPRFLGMNRIEVFTSQVEKIRFNGLVGTPGFSQVICRGNCRKEFCNLVEDGPFVVE